MAIIYSLTFETLPTGRARFPYLFPLERVSPVMPPRIGFHNVPKVKLILPVNLVVGHPLGDHNQILILLYLTITSFLLHIGLPL
jgi:hypothetical protein